MTPLWTSAELRAATGGMLAAEVAISGVSIDSRSIAPGDIFIALRDQRDGHEFVADALARGASLAMVDHTPPGAADTAKLLRVVNTLAGLTALGAAGRAHAVARVVGVTGSVGIAMYPADGRTVNDLIKNADAAMYQAKESGRAGFRFYQPRMNADLLARMRLDHAMRGALERGDFRLHYQPQVALNGGAMVGAEALLRWRDSELGEVSPADFIPLAEATGFIVTIGDWVLREAVQQAARWRAQGRSIVVSVNVSALQFQQPGFVDRVEAVLGEAGLPATLLELELTESILVQDADEALARLHALDRLGVGLAIDDFGTGYSSLSYLKRFPIGKLKIDRSFVKDLPGDESDSGIALAVIQVARAQKLRVIAEGVETAAQRDFLRVAGCDEFQGFLCAPGLSVADFERLMGPVSS